MQIVNLLRQAVTAVPNNNTNIRFEKGVFRISAEIPVAGAREAIDSLLRELNLQLLGEERSIAGQSPDMPPKMLNERDAARYIGRSVSFLRTCRYKAKRGEIDAGPRYVRLRNKFILYPVRELDDWLNRSQLFSSCMEEKIYAEHSEIVALPLSETQKKAVRDA
jgi:hypothetical protein